MGFNLSGRQAGDGAEKLEEASVLAHPPDIDENTELLLILNTHKIILILIKYYKYP